MMTYLLRGTRFRQRAAHGTLEIGPGRLDLGHAVNVVEMDLLQASQGVEQRKEIHGARRVRALGHLDRLFGLGEMRTREEVVPQPRRAHAEPRLLDNAANRVRGPPSIRL